MKVRKLHFHQPIGVIVAGWKRGGGQLEYNPALIFGATKQEWMPR